ncbi:MAG: hypothetical protein LBQ51_01840 [Desulfovibrio sp.]|nr:hypothetical protein [Desulfovibrio sp.]
MDKEGTVVFTFTDGGKIRDIGSEILFSTGSEAERLALLYARKKWGLNIITDKGRILFDRNKLERQRESFHRRPSGTKTKDFRGEIVFRYHRDILR